MSALKEYNGRFCESEFESVLISYLERENWSYVPRKKLFRTDKREVIISDDLKKFLSDRYPDFTDAEINRIIDIIRNVGSQDNFSTLHKVYRWLVDGLTNFERDDGSRQTVELIDFDDTAHNIFKVINQLPVEYTNNGTVSYRIPDILLYLNGIPVCIIELKNPADPDATIHDAWEQIYFRYWRDIPGLLYFCPLACISDGSNTRLGTIRTPYEHFYAWRRVDDDDKVNTSPFDQTETMIKGVFKPTRFLEIFRDYIYFEDENYDKDERMIVARYPQFFATRLLKRKIVEAIQKNTRQGGTYFGATGCGKTYTMAFLARQLSLRCSDIPEVGSPTIILIVDRDELQKQGCQLFSKSKEFLNLGEVTMVKNRAHLRQELSSRRSGGFYICTIQKFCNREEDPIGLINDRHNIIVFSDEAHRTQIERARRIKIDKKYNQETRALLSQPYATVLRDAFPNATYVGFSGTPILETYQTFGDEVDRYTIDQAVADGITLPIKYHPRISKVLLDDVKVREIEKYYKACADEGATEENIESSKRAMSSMEVLLGDSKRLERLAEDIHDDYVGRCEAEPDRVQKALITCSNREIGYKLLKIFESKYLEWFIPKKSPDDAKLSDEQLRNLREEPFMAMVASVGKNDPADMHEYLGGINNDVRNGELDASFKQDESNLHIVIVVDMWITGFDVPSLTYLYNDKPLQKHMLIQAISRVNRKYPRKEFGMIIDYIGIRANIREALKIYGGDISIAPNSDDVAQATRIFKQELQKLENMFVGFDLEPFINADSDPTERYRTLSKAAEKVFCSTERLNEEGKQQVSFKTYFLDTVKRMRAAYDLCEPSGDLDKRDSALAQCFMAIASMVKKMSGTSDIDDETMNRNVSEMVEEALRYNRVEDVFLSGEDEDIFSPDFYNKLSDIKMPATKLELIIKLLKRAIREYSKVNRISAKSFKDMLDETIGNYNSRRTHLSSEEAGETQEEASEQILNEATSQALELLRQLKADKERFRELGLTFEEKAFYDVLINIRNEHNFKYGDDEEVNGIIVNDECKELAKEIKKLIDEKSVHSDWLNNNSAKADLQFEIKKCLIKNGYPPKYCQETFNQVMTQVENYVAYNN